MYCVLAESDNESVPSTPLKATTTRVSVKTLEQIKLDRIQAESAAYYSFSHKLFKDDTPTKDLNFHIMSLDEIHMSKKMVEEPDSTTMRKEDCDKLAKLESAIEENRVKPIRLKRCFEANINEDSPRGRSKRVKLLDSAVSSTNMETSCEDLLDVSSSNTSELQSRSSEDDLLKDIDALLGD